MKVNLLQDYTCTFARTHTHTHTHTHTSFSFVMFGDPERVSMYKIVLNGDFPGSPVGETLRSQCRGPRFDPWLGN